MCAARVYVPHRDLHSFPTRRSSDLVAGRELEAAFAALALRVARLLADELVELVHLLARLRHADRGVDHAAGVRGVVCSRSEEHTSELQSRRELVCRLLLENKIKPYT